MRIVKIIAIGILTVILIGLLLAQIKLSDIVSAFCKVSFSSLILAFVIYTFCYLARALRFNLLLEKTVKGMFSIVSLSTMLTDLLPARLGELSYVYFLKQLKESSIGSGLATLVIARLFDLIVVGGTFLIAVFLMKNRPPFFTSVIYLIAGLLLILLAILALLMLFQQKFLKIVKRIILPTNQNNHQEKTAEFPFTGAQQEKKITTEQRGIRKYITKIYQELENLLAGFKQLQSKKRVIKIFIMSLLIWFFNYSAVYIIINQLGIKVPLIGFIIALTLSMFTAFLPVNTFGNFGTTEGVWTLVMVSFGVPKNLAIASGFGYHIIMLVFASILGFIGYINITRSKIKF